MYMNIAVGSIFNNDNDRFSKIQEQIDGMQGSFLEKFNSVMEFNEQRVEKESKRIEVKEGSLQESLAKGCVCKTKGGYQADPADHVNNDAYIATMVKEAAFRGLTGDESEGEAKAMVLANMKEFIRRNLQTALAEHINDKVVSGKVLPDNSNYIEELRKSWREIGESFIKEVGEDLLKLFGSQEELASFMASMEAELCLEERELTQVVEVQAIDPEPAAPSIRANDQVHEVPSSMEGLQAGVQRLNEKFGK